MILMPILMILMGGQMRAPLKLDTLGGMGFGALWEVEKGYHIPWEMGVS